MIDKAFEEWFNDSFPHVHDPITRSIARCAWDARWEFMVEKFKELDNEE